MLSVMSIALKAIYAKLGITLAPMAIHHAFCV